MRNDAERYPVPFSQFTEGYHLAKLERGGTTKILTLIETEHGTFPSPQGSLMLPFIQNYFPHVPSPPPLALVTTNLLKF